jgi:hypothetical protein
MPIKFSCILAVFLFGCSEKAPVSRRAPLPAQAMAAPARPDPVGPPPTSPARAPDVDEKPPWAFYRRLDAWEAEIFYKVTFCLTPGVEDVMLSLASLHHLLERAKELERHDPSRELSTLQAYIRESQDRLDRRMKRRGALGDGFHLSPYYFKPEMEQAVRLVSATFYEAVVPENSPRFFSLLYWPEGVEPRLVEWEKGRIAHSIGGNPPAPQVGKGWSQRFYLVPVILVVEIKRPRKFADVLPALTKLAQSIDADLLSVKMWDVNDSSSDTLEVQMLYRREPELAEAVRNVSIVRGHPLIKRAHLGAYQNQAIPIFWSPIVKSTRKVEK